jgi:hypothetical protein
MNTYDVQHEFQGTFPNRRTTTRFLTVHHAAVFYRQEKGISHVRAAASHHVNVKEWPGIGYHICLAEETKGGPIARYNCSDLDTVRAHVGGRNSEALGICCLTNFSNHPPEQKWIDALAEVLRELKQRYPDAEIVGHRDIARAGNGTECPGNPWTQWKQALLARVEGGAASGASPGSEPAPSQTVGTVTAGSALLVTPEATPEQCSAYMLSRPTGEYNEHDVREVIVPAYFRVCEQAGINPLLAIAQMIHETGNLTSWWAGRPRRNPAGIGVTGETRSDDPGDPHAWAWNEERGVYAAGISFETWTDHAIPAHVGRLLAYTLPSTASLTNEQRRLIAYALGLRPLPEPLRGCAPTLDGLVGTWASPGRQMVEGREVTYAELVADIADRILRR